MSSWCEVIFECSLCRTMSNAVLKCEQGHSMCENCVKNPAPRFCPTCGRSVSTTRNYSLKQLFESRSIPSFIPNKMRKLEPLSTEADYKQRIFPCEGNRFAKWPCAWSGQYTELEDHFKEIHRNYLKNDKHIDLDINLEVDKRDVQLISYRKGAQYFWYKFVVDVAQEKVYWIFQFIGPKEQAQKYCYEFKITNGPVKEFIVADVCQSDQVSDAVLMKEEKCIVLSFKTLMGYLNHQGKLEMLFRILTSAHKQKINR